MEVQCTNSSIFIFPRGTTFLKYIHNVVIDPYTNTPQ